MKGGEKKWERKNLLLQKLQQQEKKEKKEKEKRKRKKEIYERQRKNS